MHSLLAISIHLQFINFALNNLNHTVVQLKQLKQYHYENTVLISSHHVKFGSQ